MIHNNAITTVIPTLSYYIVSTYILFKRKNNANASSLFGNAFFFLGCFPVPGEGEGYVAVSVFWGPQAK